ncbi:MAG TPA: DUF348 domain-containing protein [Clostridiaceae bacterium]|nr:DUF348 domain-containing protein [Clostridiaceae bacterium]
MKRLIKSTERIIAVGVLIIVTLAGLGLFEYLRRDVVISCGTERIVLKTMKNTVEEVLEEAGVEVVPDDYISVPLDSILHKTKINDIQIKKAVPVYVEVDGQEIKLMSCKETVKDALAAGGINLSPLDRLEYADLDDIVVENMKLKIVRVDVREVNEEIPIPYQVVMRENDKLEHGKEKVVRQGEEGVEQKTYKVVYEDGKEVKRELLIQKILSAPIDKIVEIGTMLTYKTARGDTIRYSKVLNMRATAYTSSFEDTGKNPDHPQFGITYTGIKAKKGVIAVDPKVIPLGTKVYVEVAGSTPDYGYAVAADIGGAIKGDLIDLYFEDVETVRSWGIKRVKVYILEE